MQDPTVQLDSLAWRVQVWLAFLISTAMLTGGIALLPVELWIKGYLAMGAIFCIGSTVSLVKTIRDAHEAKRYENRLEKAKSHKLLKEFEIDHATTRPAA